MNSKLFMSRNLNQQINAQVEWPQFRDWTHQAHQIFCKIYSLRYKIQKTIQNGGKLDEGKNNPNSSSIFASPSVFDTQLNNIDNSNIFDTEIFTKFVNLEKQGKKLMEEFTQRCQLAVKLYLKVRPTTPSDQYSFYGEKYAQIGGVVIMQTSNMNINMPEINQNLASILRASQDIMDKLASIQVKAHQTVRNLLCKSNYKFQTLEQEKNQMEKQQKTYCFKNLVIPLCTTVQYLGRKYLAISASPISYDTIVYGSFSSNGLVVFEHKSSLDSKVCYQIASQIRKALNLDGYYFAQGYCRDKIPPLLQYLQLPYQVQIHYNKQTQKYYIHNLAPLLVPDIRGKLFEDVHGSVKKKIEQVQEHDILINFLKLRLNPQFVLRYSSQEGEIQDGWEYFTWLKPERCSECGDWLQQYEYYSFEKYKVDKNKSLSKRYLCCLTCYQLRIPTDSFKVPAVKLQRKILPTKFRRVHWRQKGTNLTRYELPLKPLPLNPTAAFFEMLSPPQEVTVSHVKQDQTGTVSTKQIDLHVTHIQGNNKPQNPNPENNANPNTKTIKLQDEYQKQQNQLIRAGLHIRDTLIQHLIQDLNQLNQNPSTPQHLLQIMHSRGIQTRLIGVIARNVTAPHLQSLAYTIIISRSIRQLIKDSLRFHYKIPQSLSNYINYQHSVKCVNNEQIYADVIQNSTQRIWAVTIEQQISYVLKLLNLILSDDANDDDQSNRQESSKSSKLFWDIISQSSLKKYDIRVDKNILASKNIHLPLLVLSVFALINIPLGYQLKKIANDLNSSGVINIEEFLEKINSQNAELDVGHYKRNHFRFYKRLKASKDIELYTSSNNTSSQQTLASINNIITKPQLNCVAIGLAYCNDLDRRGKRQQWFSAGGFQRQLATQAYRRCCMMIQNLYGQQSIQYARVVKQMAQQLESRHQEKGRPQNSNWNRSAGILDDDLAKEARFLFLQAARIFQNNSIYKQDSIKFGVGPLIEVAQCYLAIAKLIKNKPPKQYRGDKMFESVNKGKGVEDEYQNPQALLQKASQIYEDILGYDHPDCANAYINLGLFYSEKGDYKNSSLWLRQAFCTFHKIFGGKDELTTATYAQLIQIQRHIDSGLDKVPIDELPVKIVELELRMSSDFGNVNKSQKGIRFDNDEDLRMITNN